MLQTSSQIIDVPADQVHELTEDVIQGAVQDMLHGTEPQKQRESLFFVQVLTQRSLEGLHDRIAAFLDLEHDDWIQMMPAISIDQKWQTMVMSIQNQPVPDDQPSAPIKVANYLWATVSGRDDDFD
jgi:hypothetical protein